MDRITELVPQPRRASLGGADWLVWPATLIDIAELQAWLDQSWPCPLEWAWDRLYGPDAIEGEERWSLLRGSLSVAREGPPAWDDDRGAERLGRWDGIVMVLWLALRKAHPELTAEGVVDVAARSTASEIAAVRRAWLGVDPVHELERALMEGAVPAKSGPGVTWRKAIHETAEAFGWTYPQVYAMTLAEFVNARTGGKTPEGPEYDSPPAEITDRLKGPGSA